MNAVITGDQAMLLLNIANAQNLPMTPVRYPRSKDKDAKALERHGLLERHYIGKHFGAFVTEKGLTFLVELAKDRRRYMTNKKPGKSHQNNKRDNASTKE